MQYKGKPPTARERVEAAASAARGFVGALAVQGFVPGDMYTIVESAYKRSPFEGSPFSIEMGKRSGGRHFPGSYSECHLEVISEGTILLGAFGGEKEESLCILLTGNCYGGIKLSHVSLCDGLKVGQLEIYGEVEGRVMAAAIAHVKAFGMHRVMVVAD